MNSLKTTFVVLVLAGVLYGVYVTLTGPGPSSDTNSSHQSGLQPPSIDFGPASQVPALPGDMGIPAPYPAPPSSNIPAGRQEDPSAPSTADRALYTPPAQPGSLDPSFEVSPAAPTGPPPFTPPGDTSPPAVNAGPYESPAPAEPPPSSTPPATTPTLEAYKLKQAWQAVDQCVKDGKYRDALAALSPFAANPQLSPEDRRAVLTWLDALAGKVIYSPEHFLSPPLKVIDRGQTLYDVANQYKVPVQLLLNVNTQKVSDPSVLLPGTELKVIPGPFRADANLAAGELTLYLGDLYAGRFAFTAGDERPAPGAYRVQQKNKERAYIGRDGRQIAPGDPANPYGNCWIDLGREVSLHGSPLANTGVALGCLSFNPQDAQDLYGILSVESEVTIR